MIGILGGTFDPIHRGHLHIATQVVERLALDELQLMPCAKPVHRARPMASAEQRSDMIRLAIEGLPRLCLNTLELERDGPSFSVDSLRQLKARSSAVFVLVLGADAFNGFDGWKSPDEILKMAHLVVCGRPGFRLDSNLCAGHRADTPAQLGDCEAGLILPLEVDAVDCSSSQLRAELAQGRIDSQILPPGVADYIDHHQLYRYRQEQVNYERNTR